MGSFKKKISEDFKIPIRQFKFVNKNSSSELNESVDDDISLKDYGWCNVYMIYRKINKSDEIADDNYHPKKLISDSPEYLDLLFMLLSNPNSGFNNKL